MYYLSTSCLILFFLFSFFHHLPCASSIQERGLCETLFQCGNITAGYPFWGENRLKHCGHPLLELRCFKNITSIFISNQEFFVSHINQTSNTLTLVRTDLLGSICSSRFTTTTLPPDIFELSPTYKSLTIFYFCASVVEVSNNNCPNRGLVIVSENPDEYHNTCGETFSVNVPKSFVSGEKEFNMTNFESVLSKGFEVKVKINDTSCQECSSSHGSCDFNETLPLGAKCSPLHPLPPTDGLSTGVKAVIAVGASVLGLVAMLILAGWFCLIGRRRMTQEAQYTSRDLPITKEVACLSCVINQQTKTSALSQEYLKALIPLKQYSYVQVKKITKSFAEVIGKGGFGTVYRGTLTDGHSVAVKILKDSKGNGEDFINEVASMSKTSHVNIVSLLGFCSEGSKRAIIYEYLENGSLDQFISSNTSMNVDWMALYGIALGVARGLEYLHHGCKTKIVHFDIKPQNILLDDNLCPKVSDFGLAKLCKKKESILSLLDTRGTIGYIAPEVFSRMYGRVSHKSDVYSYGMLVLEMIGARNKERDYQNSASDTSSTYFPEWIYKDLEKDNVRLIENGISSEEEEVARKMTLVGLWCIQPSPTDRPSMNRVVEMMEGSVGAIEIPPRPGLQIPAAPLQESSMLSENILSCTEYDP